MSQIISEVDFFVPRRGAIVTAADLARSESGLLHLLDAHTKINADYLETYPDTPRLYESGVVYRREKRRRKQPEKWRDIPNTLRRRYGDCEELGTWLCAERQVYDGLDAWPDIIGLQVGNKFLYHVRCGYADGSIEDPSKVLGMRARKVG